jgi:hypothetical protein
MKPTELFGRHSPPMTYRYCGYGKDCHEGGRI